MAGRAKARNKRHSTIVRRLKAAGVAYGANDALGDHLLSGDVDRIRSGVEAAMSKVLDALIIDRADPHSADTAARVARLYVDEVFAGRYQPRPRIADFPNGKKLDELYALGPIAVRSACAHHLCPVVGSLWVGVIPSDRVIGISKFSRLSRWILARPQIQEDAIVQIADELERLIKPRGLAVTIRATHSCLTWRGVQEHSTSMTTSVLRGIIKESAAARTEFYKMIEAQGFSCQ